MEERKGKFTLWLVLETAQMSTLKFKSKFSMIGRKASRLEGSELARDTEQKGNMGEQWIKEQNNYTNKNDF